MENKTIQLNFPPEVIKEQADKMLSKALTDEATDKMEKALVQDFHTLISLAISFLKKKEK